MFFSILLILVFKPAHAMSVKLFVFFICLASIGHAQVTTDPAFPTADQPVTITVDVSGTPLADYTNDVWIWSWIKKSTPNANIDAPTNVNPATATQSAAQMTRSGSNSNIYSITFTPTDFFNQSDVDEFELGIGLLLKGADWSDGQTIDYGFDISNNQFAVSFTAPSSFPILVNPAEIIQITAVSSESADLSLEIDNVEVTTVTGTELNYMLTATASGIHTVKIIANNGTDEVTESFTYTVRSGIISESRPAGIIDGINYHEDDTKVTLSILAPHKNNVYAVGDFSNWKIESAYQMKKDGDHFWIEINGLSPGSEYGFQYLVDESIWIADPYTDKILDTDDQWISSATYPNLKPYPVGANHGLWYQNKVSVFQTNQTAFAWQNDNFSKPNKEELIIYELLVRDFLGEEKMNYNALIDNLDYIEGLGVNAIELMPIMEFNGNDSWGYNPTFMFAVDKAYGSKNDLKAFIDAAHGRGIAVILDMVMNQNDIPSPYAQMYFDFDNFKPTVENPWFNADATHPYNVFFDINHESAYTQNWLDSINHYWINEFHFDGYRFDLSKGFTQRNSRDNVSQWGQKDDSRIAILKRMADEIWRHTPDAYVILEHFADNTEEKELADYGMMLWGNSAHDYGDAMKGLGGNKSLAWASHETRGWANSHVVAYMESHDEERQMFNLKRSGSSGSGYDITQENIALQRLSLGAAFFFTVLGPKMFWQWGEFGYDVSIEENGRTGRKPTHWEYLDKPYHNQVYEYYKELIGLRRKYDVFSQGDFTWKPDGNFKSIHLSNADTSIVIVGNFDVKSGFSTPGFQHTGTWYDFFSGELLQVNDTNVSLELKAGEFHIYTDVPLPQISFILNAKSTLNREVVLFPNPVNDMLQITGLAKSDIFKWTIFSLSGQRLKVGDFSHLDIRTINVASIKKGLYTLQVEMEDSTQSFRFFKK